MSKNTLRDIQKVQKKKDRLRELLKSFKDENGVISKKRAYLHTSEGKEILTLMWVELFEELGRWPEVTKLLQRSKSAIEKALSFHKIRKMRPRKLAWTEEAAKITEDYFRKSHSVRKRAERNQLKQELKEKLKRELGRTVSFNGISCFAKDYPWGQWGMTSQEREKQDREILSGILDNERLSHKEQKEAIIAAMPFFASWGTIKARIRALGYKVPSEQKTITAWQDNSKVVNRLKDLIFKKQVLAKAPTLEEGLRQLVDEVRKELSIAEEAFNEETLKAGLDEIIWAPKVDEALRKSIREELNPETEFSPYFPHIPPALIQKRVREIRGVSRTKRSARAIPGIGRITSIEEISPAEWRKFKMPRTSPEDPYVIVRKKTDDFSLLFLNGPSIGTRHPGDIHTNVARLALSDADSSKDIAVIATNIIALDLKKAGGPTAVGRALAMGDNINPEIFADPEYRREVEGILKNNSQDQVIYQTTEELLDNLLAGWRKITIKPDETPEFPEKIYVVLGANEEDLILAIAYWEYHYWTKVKQQKLEAHMKVVKTALGQAHKNEDIVGEARLENELKQLQAQHSRTRVSNVATQEKHRYEKLARMIVIRKIEEAIPNSKVIGKGTSYIKIGKKTIEINIPSHQRITDSLLKDYTGSYGPKVLSDTLADGVVICHPWSLNCRATVRETDHDGKRASTKVFVAPIAVDGEFLGKVFSDVIVPRHAFHKVINNVQFQDGVLRLRSTNGILDADVHSSKSLRAHEIYARKALRKRRMKKTPNERPMPYVDICGPQYIWGCIGTDPHEGGRGKEWVVCAKTKKQLGMCDAVFEMMRREGLCEKEDMPVHLFSLNDDPTQGQNFNARVQPHPHQFSPSELAERAREILLGMNDVDSKESLEKMYQLFLANMQHRGTDFPLEQMFEVIERFIDPNIDIFGAILRRAQKARILIRGVGEFTNPDFGGYDTRNAGIIHLGSGNHLEKTVDGEIVEGPFYANHLRNRLANLDEWKDQENFLKKAVVAPHYSGEAIAWGTLGVLGGYEYGLEVRASPPRMSGWGDPLLGAVKNDPQRGNYSRIFNGKLALKTYGDKHFFSFAITPYAIYFMSASGTHTDRYGERGFPPNNSGVSFVGLPIDGPESGPILLRILPYDVIRDYMEDKPRTFNWEKFLPNPA